MHWVLVPFGAPDLSSLTILHGALVPVLHIETNVQTSNLAHFTLKLQLGTGYYLGLVLP